LALQIELSSLLRLETYALNDSSRNSWSLGFNLLLALLLRFDQMAERLNMEISLNKRKSLTISRNYTKCEVQLRGIPIEQVPQFNYLGAEISAKRDLKQEVRTQVMKATRISGCLYNLI